MEKKFYIYMHKNIKNGKMYVGQTQEENVEVRWRSGFSKNYNNHLRAAYKKYGKDNFQSIVLCEASNQEEADYLEKFYIAKYDLQNPEKGYNKTNGGKSFSNITPEIKQKISESLKTSELFLNNNYKSHAKKVVGINIKTLEIVRFNSQREAGAYFNISPSAIGNSCVGRIKTAANYMWRFDDDSFTGFDTSEVMNIRKCSTERKEKIKAALSGRPGKITRQTPVIGFYTSSNTVKIFNTAVDAARMLGIHCIKNNKTLNLERQLYSTKGWYFFNVTEQDKLTDEIKSELIRRYKHIKKYKNNRNLNLNSSTTIPAGSRAKSEPEI